MSEDTHTAIAIIHTRYIFAAASMICCHTHIHMREEMKDVLKRCCFLSRRARLRYAVITTHTHTLLHYYAGFHCWRYYILHIRPCHAMIFLAITTYYFHYYDFYAAISYCFSHIITMHVWSADASLSPCELHITWYCMSKERSIIITP